MTGAPKQCIESTPAYAGSEAPWQHGLAYGRRCFRQADHRSPRPADRIGPLARFVRALVQIGTNNHLGHDSIRARSKTIADSGIHVETTDLEIDYSIDVVLLLVERYEVLDRTEVGVVLDTQREVFTELPRKTRRRCEYGISVMSESEINDRIDDELVIALAPTDNWPDLHIHC